MDPNTICVPSEKIICRDILGKMIIVPIESGIADFDDAMFSFNETGALVWKCIEQKKTFKEICRIIEQEFESDIKTIETGVKNLLVTLLKKNIITKWNS